METTYDEDLCTVYDSEKSQCSLSTDSCNPQGNLVCCLSSQKSPVWYTAQATKNSEIIVQVNKRGMVIQDPGDAIHAGKRGQPPDPDPHILEDKKYC
jgi:hypothetical protein